LCSIQKINFCEAFCFVAGACDIRGHAIFFYKPGIRSLRLNDKRKIFLPISGNFIANKLLNMDSRALGILKSHKVHAIFWMSITVIDWLEWLIIQILNGSNIQENFFKAVMYTTWPFWILFGPIVVRYSSKNPFRNGEIARSIFNHLVFGVGLILSLIVVQTILMTATSQVFFSATDTLKSLPNFFLYTLNIRLFTYFFLVAATQSVNYFDTVQRVQMQNSKLQAQLAEAKLKTLHMQIQPHFLFNTHQAIAGLMLKNEIDKALEMLSGLSTLLRQTLVVQQEQFIPLKQELIIVKEYLTIQQSRFHDRLSVSIAEPKELLDAKVPPFILQPLIENAIQHGFAPYADSGRIEVNVYREKDRLYISVRDDGGGLRHLHGRKGIGLQNVRARLEEHYRNQYVFTLTNHPVKGAIATLAIPLEFIPMAEKSSEQEIVNTWQE
jgi:two-component system, LytTR family, sensor kinase